MKLVVIESPLSGDFERNVRYAKLCMLDALTNHNEAPFASHLLYTQCLDDESPKQRKLGMEAGFFWAEVAAGRVVYNDLGVSGGMKAGIAKAEEMGQTVEYRQLPPELMEQLDGNTELQSTQGFRTKNQEVQATGS